MKSKIDIFDRLKNKIENKYLMEIKEYIDLDINYVCLDGNFTIDDLKILIKAMEELNKKYQEEIGQ